MPALLVATFVIVILLCASPVTAIVTYDYRSDATLSFSRTWSDVSSGVPPSQALTSGVGTHSESTQQSQNFGVDNLGYFQSVQITGSAGDPTLTFSGTSVARRDLYTVFTFDFGDVATDFAFTLNFTHITDSSKQVPGGFSVGQFGEFVGGSVGTQLLFDGEGGAFYGGVPITFHNLAGTHTMRIGTFAEATAIADYASPVPEPSSLVLVTSAATGIAVCRFWKRRRRRGARR